MLHNKTSNKIYNLFIYWILIYMYRVDSVIYSFEKTGALMLTILTIFRGHFYMEAHDQFANNMTNTCNYLLYVPILRLFKSIINQGTLRKTRRNIKF